MFYAIRTVVPPTVSLLLLLSAVGCQDADLPVSPTETGVEGMEAQLHTQPTEAEVNQDLAALRRATAPLHRLEAAEEAGWDLKVTECKENPPVGGMGYHYGNLGLYLDGDASVVEPEVLLYEPRPDGSLHLVAVEYLIPYFAWQGEVGVDDPPRLFGQEMKRADDHGEWQLHVWIWKHNPAGLFADWNPTVDCGEAT